MGPSASKPRCFKAESQTKAELPTVVWQGRSGDVGQVHTHTPLPLPHPCSPVSSEDLQKAVVSLHLEWDRLLERDNVTLKCQGAQAEGQSSTRWWHNGHLLPSQTSSHFIASTSVNDSGEYTCQTSLSNLSNPVQLQVCAGEWVMGARGVASKG